MHTDFLRMGIADIMHVIVRRHVVVSEGMSCVRRYTSHKVGGMGIGNMRSNVGRGKCLVGITVGRVTSKPIRELLDRRMMGEWDIGVVVVYSAHCVVIWVFRVVTIGRNTRQTAVVNVTERLRGVVLLGRRISAWMVKRFGRYWRSLSAVHVHHVVGMGTRRTEGRHGIGERRVVVHVV